MDRFIIFTVEDIPAQSATAGALVLGIFSFLEFFGIFLEFFLNFLGVSFELVLAAKC